MFSQAQKSPPRTLASPALLDAYQDFLLSRQAKNATESTLSFYRFTTLTFLLWAEEQGITSPEQFTARHVRAYISKLREGGKQDTTLHAHSRAIRTLVRFWHEEKYMPELIKFEMPKLAKKRLPILTAEELQQILKACDTRDKAIVMLMADSGLRRGETIRLNWGDVNMATGLIRVEQGKGRKDRASAVGSTTRRALLVYKRTVPHTEDMPLFQSRVLGNDNHRLTGTGLLIVYRRLTEKTGIHVTPHAMRRTFTILALRARMRLLHLQHLGGWSDVSMIDHYAQMVDEDLLQEHKAHSPVDNLR